MKYKVHSRVRAKKRRTESEVSAGLLLLAHKGSLALASIRFASRCIRNLGTQGQDGVEALTTVVEQGDGVAHQQQGETDELRVWLPARMHAHMSNDDAANYASKRCATDRLSRVSARRWCGTGHRSWMSRHA